MNGRGDDHADARTGRTGRRTGRGRARRERRILLAGLLGSVLVHAIALLVIGGLLESRRTPPPRPGPIVVEPPAGMRAVNVVAVAGEQPATVVEPPSPDREEVVIAAPTPREAPPTPTTPVPDELTAADRLAPRLVDPRLWRPMVLIPGEPTLADVQARIGAAVELLSDSALADAERQIRATDWTVMDADGEKWGISPGVIHLGKVKIPLPIYWVEEYDPARDQWYELEAQVDRARFLESFEDRVRIIRERRDRERRERIREEGGAVTGGGNGGG